MEILINRTGIHAPTYGQLEAMLPSTGNNRIPGCRQILCLGAEPILKAHTDNSVITVFSNGFYLYETSKQHTVFAVDRVCQRRRDAALDKAKDKLAGQDWYGPLEAAALYRLEDNSNSRENDHRQKYFTTDNADRCDRRLAKAAVADDLLTQMVEAEEKSERAKALRDGLRKLTKKQRQVVILTYYKGLTQEQIAGMMGISQASVSVTLKRGEKNLKNILEKRL